MGCFAACLAAPVVFGVPGAEFVLSELASPMNEERRNGAYHWLKLVIVEGLDQGLDLLRETLAGTAADMGYGGTSFGSLVDGVLSDLQGITGAGIAHYVGLHVYHYVNTEVVDGGARASYTDWRDDGQILDDLEKFREVVVEGSGRDGLRWMIGELGYPAEGPWSELQLADGVVYNADTTEGVQANLLVRRTLLALSQWPAHVIWFTRMSAVQDPRKEWSEFATFGIRVDVDPDVAAADFSQSMARQRPAWFALRRLAHVLSTTTKVQLLLHDVNLKVIVVRLYSWTGFTDPEGLSSYSHHHAYAVWGYERDTDRVHRLTGEFSFRVLPLVPEIASTSTSDPFGYGVSEVREWICPSEIEETSDDEASEHRLEFRSGDEEPPLFLFSDTYLEEGDLTITRVL
jgi:hypothetical protein